MTAETATKPILGVILGDAAGVGPELIAKIIADGFLEETCRPIILGDRRVLEAGMKTAGVSFPIHEVNTVEEAQFVDGAWIIDAKDLDPATITVGDINIACGKACGDAIVKAIGLFKEGKIDGFVFAPFNKTSLKKAGFNFESEHWLFAHYFGVTTPFGEINVLGDLMTSRVTSHIPIKDVSSRLTTDNILRAIHLLNDTLRKAGVAKPRLGVAGLNPHCGEHGLCGREEIDVIEPAVAMAQQEGIDAVGPIPADILFIRAFNGEFNAAVTMYHDQGQIALKLKGFDYGITVAGGMPAPIVTPAHGTAYDIAGKNLAKTEAMKNAVRMAAKMARHRPTPA
ncbi:MAG: 4-hydroxythreonine-4-phosphate dehydrogenase PdxA [Planctomycetes bacterium]|nr:4-hydroxythreonine-4-phosphate dehydrogenase PdxA [Planctomycetota bacterium]